MLDSWTGGSRVSKYLYKGSHHQGLTFSIYKVPPYMAETKSSRVLSFDGKGLQQQELWSVIPLLSLPKALQQLL